MTFAEKSSALAVFDRKGHVKETKKQLGDTEIYEEISNGTKPRSNRPEVFLGKGVLKICSKFTGDTHAEV